MSTIPPGRPFHGEFSAEDASALTEQQARFALYPNAGAGGGVALVLAASDQVVITDILVVTGAALTVTLFSGDDAEGSPGLFILRGELAAKAAVSQCLRTPHYCQQGSYPKVMTSGAGQIDATLRGYIQRNGQ